MEGNLVFISGNKHKYEELKSVFPNLEMKSIDLPEIQQIDSTAIVKAKLIEAMKYSNDAMIVEDTSLCFEALGGELPGPLIKWFVESLGSQKLAEMVLKLGNTRAIAKTLIGYAQSIDEIYFFEGRIEGTIVTPKAKSAFGRDPIFQPDGYVQTFAEMGSELKNQISQRKLAAEALKSFLENR